MKKTLKYFSLLFLGIVYVGSILIFIVLGDLLNNFFTSSWLVGIFIYCFVCTLVVSLVNITSKTLKYIMNTSETTIPSRILEPNRDVPGAIPVLSSKSINKNERRHFFTCLVYFSSLGTIEFHTAEEGHIISGIISSFELENIKDGTIINDLALQEDLDNYQLYVNMFSEQKQQWYRLAVHPNDKFVLVIE